LTLFSDKKQETMMKTHSNILAKSLTESRQDDQSSIKYYACTTEPTTLPCLITDIARENSEVALVVATAIAISIVIYAVSKSVAVIITAWRSNNNIR
jgi:hypothetical protein